MTTPNSPHPWVQQILDLDSRQQFASLAESHWRVMASIYGKGENSGTLGASECQRELERINGLCGPVNENCAHRVQLEERSNQLCRSYASQDSSFNEELRVAREAWGRDLNHQLQAQKDAYKMERGLARGRVADLTGNSVPAASETSVPVATDVVPVQEAIVAGRGEHFTGVAEGEWVAPPEVVDGRIVPRVAVQVRHLEDAELRQAELREQTIRADE